MTAAAAGFRIRKVRTNASLGDRLKRSRVRKKLSIAEVEEATKIRAKFILALEADSWDQIPSEVYGKGYLERYAQFLGLDSEAFLSDYERGRATYWRACSDAVALAPERIARSWFIITPKFLIWTLAACFVVIGAGIVGSQLSRYTAAPYLELVTPVQAREIGASQLELSARTFELEGKTATGATVTVNSQPVAVRDDGTFVVTLSLQEGVNPVVVEATSQSGVVTRETRSIVVR
jgi:cytoskeletal protein RodZ